MLTWRSTDRHSSSFRLRTLMLLWLASASCSLLPTRTVVKTVIEEKIVEVPVVHEVVKQCIVETSAMPTMPPPPTECVPGQICWPVPEAAVLLNTIRTLFAIIRDYETACGPPATQPSTGDWNQ